MSKFLQVIAFCSIIGCAAPKSEPVVQIEEPTNKPLKEESYYPSGDLKMMGTTVNGERHGIWTSYFEDGGIWSKSEYNNGVLNGVSIVYHRNGTTYYSGTYAQGEKIGIWSYYLENGDPAKTVDFDSQ